MNKVKRIFLIMLVVLACAGCDQSTKYLASNNLEFNKISSFFKENIMRDKSHDKTRQ